MFLLRGESCKEIATFFARQYLYYQGECAILKGTIFI